MGHEFRSAFGKALSSKVEAGGSGSPAGVQPGGERKGGRSFRADDLGGVAAVPQRPLQ